MRKTKLIIVTGAPGTGKTTLAKKISSRFKLPLIVKDDIKEVLFDTLGWNIEGWDPDSWQKKLGRGAIEVMHHINERLISTGTTHIVESNFVPEFANERFSELIGDYNLEVLQVYCKTDPEVLIQRFEDRIKDPNRHPGHAEDTYMDELKESLANNRFGKIDLKGEFMEFDTTEFLKLDEGKVIERVKKFLKK